MRTFILPQRYTPLIESLLNKRGFSLYEPKPLAQAVLKLSDFYLTQPEASSPLHETWAQVAYLAYFFPLNWARNAAVVAEGLKRWNFFAGVQTILDYGSGLGAGVLALEESWPESYGSYQEFCIDTSSEALDLQKELRAGGPAEKTNYLSRLPQAVEFDPQKTLGLLSYVYTELEELPVLFEKCSKLMILEPATREDGRRLLRLRESLLEKGFHAWAPCPHQGPCSLLHGSERDWCHDRIGFEGPEWWQALESHLPMKNRTLTMSYLLLSREAQPSFESNRARLVGDTLVEKGKSRQLLCHDSKRQFLAWFPQRLAPLKPNEQELQLGRGDWIALGSGLETKSDELRFKDRDQLKVLDSHEK